MKRLKLNKITNKFKVYFYALGRKRINFYYASLSFRDCIYLMVSSIRYFFGLFNKHKRNYRSSLERDLSKLFGIDHVYLFGSGRSALYALLKAASFSAGDEVLVTGFTCLAVPNAILNAGLRPVYMDIDKKSFNLNPEEIKRKISSRTRAIVVQHSFGIPADIDSIMQIAKEHKLIVIEDCAAAIYSRYSNKYVGTFGDAAIFSFELSKTITVGWGGFALIKNEDLNAKFSEIYKQIPELDPKSCAKKLFQAGLSGLLYRSRSYLLNKIVFFIISSVGLFSSSTSQEEKLGKLPKEYLWKLVEPQCKVAKKQITKLPYIKSKALSVVERYQKVLKGIKYSSARPGQEQDPTYLRFPFLVKDKKKAVDLFKQNLVELGEWFNAPISNQSIDHELFLYKKGDCPVSESVCNHIVNLPTHIRLSNSDVDKICKVLQQYLNKYEGAR
jgi:dTDP-4-amino-4,6-dideoxygalactose transaminase